MVNHIYESFGEICPETNQRENITIEYAEVSMLNAPKKSYKALTATCDNENCRLSGSAQCKLFLKHITI